MAILSFSTSVCRCHSLASLMRGLHDSQMWFMHIIRDYDQRGMIILPNWGFLFVKLIKAHILAVVFMLLTVVARFIQNNIDQQRSAKY